MTKGKRKAESHLGSIINILIIIILLYFICSYFFNYDLTKPTLKIKAKIIDKIIDKKINSGIFCEEIKVGLYGNAEIKSNLENEVERICDDICVEKFGEFYEVKRSVMKDCKENEEIICICYKNDNTN